MQITGVMIHENCFFSPKAKVLVQGIDRCFYREALSRKRGGESAFTGKGCSARFRNSGYSESFESSCVTPF